MDKNAYSLEAYSSIRAEIRARLDAHFRLTLAKYVLVGALLAFLLTSQDGVLIPVSPFLVAAIFAFLLDVAILENLGWIRSAGTFIKDRIENTDLRVVRWESEGAQAGGRWNCFNLKGFLFGSWSIGFFLSVGAVVAGVDYQDRVQLFTLLLTVYLLLYSLYLAITHLGTHGGHASPAVPDSPIVDGITDTSPSGPVEPRHADIIIPHQPAGHRSREIRIRIREDAAGAPDPEAGAPDPGDRGGRSVPPRQRRISE